MNKPQRSSFITHSWWPIRPVVGVILVCLPILSGLLLLTGNMAPLAAAGAIAIIWIGAIPGILHLQGIDRSTIPVMGVAGLYYVVFFALPAFAISLGYLADGEYLVYFRHPISTITADVSWVVAAGLGLMITGFYIARFFLFARLPRFRISTKDAIPQHFQILFWLLLGYSLAYRYIPMLQTIPSIGQLAAPSALIGLGGLYLQWLSRELPRSQLILLIFVCVPLDVWARIKHLMITETFLLILFFAFLFWRNGQRRLLALLFGLGVLLVLAYSVAAVVRLPDDGSVVRFKNFASEVRQQAATPWKDTKYASPPDSPSATYKPQISPLVHRVGQVWLLQHVYEQTPEKIPYWGGETYLPLFTAFIPRIIYPDKPEERAGGAFGERYKIKDYSTDPTSINIPWLTELFINFGMPGVLIGMSIFGVFLGGLVRFFADEQTTYLEYLIGLTLIFPLSYQESNFSVMTGSMPWVFVFLYLYFRFGLFSARKISTLG